MRKEELRYLQRLAELYPTIGKASTEIINLQSILNLPKGTEHFLSDLHGEYEAFSHVLRNGSGAVRKKIDDVFGHTLSNSDKRALATLIYYPKDKIDVIKNEEEFYNILYKKFKDYLFKLNSVKRMQRTLNIRIRSKQDIKDNIESIKIYVRGHNLFDIFYGRYHGSDEQAILKKYIDAAPRETFQDIFDAIDSFVYFENRRK